MAYVVTYKGRVVAGPFFSSGDAWRAREKKSNEGGVPVGFFEIEDL